MKYTLKIEDLTIEELNELTTKLQGRVIDHRGAITSEATPQQIEKVEPVVQAPQQAPAEQEKPARTYTTNEVATACALAFQKNPQLQDALLGALREMGVATMQDITDPAQLAEFVEKVRKIGVDI